MSKHANTTCKVKNKKVRCLPFNPNPAEGAPLQSNYV